MATDDETKPSGGQPLTADALAASDLDAQIFERQIKPLITADVIDEHRRTPIGFHSLELERILVYLRRQPQTGKYVIVCTQRDAEWAIGELSGVRGTGPRVVGDERYPSLEAAEHGVFLRRLEALDLQPAGGADR
jgi:hypothetical protein